jgi:hypothetical protein
MDMWVPALPKELMLSSEIVIWRFRSGASSTTVRNNPMKAVSKTAPGVENFGPRPPSVGRRRSQPSSPRI